MTTGALIFAFNNERTDYVALAAWSADNIRRHLQIPVAVVTDCTDQTKLTAFDQVIYAKPDAGGSRYFEDYQGNVTWYNAGRIDAYSLTPWDQTLVLDADYVVASNNLKIILDLPKEFLCFRKSFDVTRPSDRFLETFGRGKFPMWWATVMMFRKSTKAQFIFDSMHMIRNNWNHYVELYGIENTTYRNDYALSIALGIVYGHALTVDSIPWPMAAAMPLHVIESVATDGYYVKYRDAENRDRYISLDGLDFHAMGKKQLEKIIASSS